MMPANMVIVPSNMFAVVILGYIQEIFSDVLEDATIGAIAKNYKKRLKKASNIWTNKNQNNETICV